MKHCNEALLLLLLGKKCNNLNTQIKHALRGRKEGSSGARGTPCLA